MMTRYKMTIAGLLLSAALPALAHPGHVPGHGFWSGVVHPMTGIDHVLVLLLVGAWFSRSHAGWPAGTSLVAGLVAGVLAAGFLPAMVYEALVLLSLPVAAGAAVTGRGGPWVTAVLTTGLYFHGQAHVAALGAAFTPGLVLGLALGSIAVLVIGQFTAVTLRALHGRVSVRS